eukprot:5232668-Alexandrium_andersonii.AAC.1
MPTRRLLFRRPVAAARDSRHCCPRDLVRESFGRSSKAEGSRGILNDLIFTSGVDGHGGRFGVFAHASTDGAGFYARSSRQQWPTEPMCVVEAIAT